jgi:transposase
LRQDFLADNPLYTKRFAYYVGRPCRGATPIKEVAAELKLDWHTVKALDQQYMEAQLKRAGTPSPKAIGIDEIAIRKGHSYRIVVSDLVRRRPIWFGGKDRSEASMGEFYAWLGPKKSSHRRLAGRDRRYIKGQKYTLLSRKENLTLDGMRALKTLLSANKRLNSAYVLKESFGQLWSYEREGWGGVSSRTGERASSGRDSNLTRNSPR